MNAPELKSYKACLIDTPADGYAPTNAVQKRVYLAEDVDAVITGLMQTVGEYKEQFHLYQHNECLEILQQKERIKNLESILDADPRTSIPLVNENIQLRDKIKDLQEALKKRSMIENRIAQLEKECHDSYSNGFSKGYEEGFNDANK